MSYSFRSDPLNVLMICKYMYEINRGYILFLGEYQIYFIECVENISNFKSV